MINIRSAVPEDASRIAEIIIVNYRVNFYPFFRNDAFYFKELNVLDMARDLTANAEALRQTWVYDDGVVKGVIRLNGSEIQKLFVEPQFQNQHIGAQLLDHAVNTMHASWLWALAYNERGISFYQRHGFQLTGETMTEDDCAPLVKMALMDAD